MGKRLTFNSVILILMPVFGIYGCLTESKNDSSKLEYEWDAPILSLNQSKHSYTEGQIYSHCEDGKVKADTVGVHKDYAILTGTLYVWDSLEAQGGICHAEVFSGISSTLVGTWTTNDLAFAEAEIPTSGRPSHCLSGPSDSLTHLLDSLNEIWVQTQSISETYDLSKRHEKYSAELCYGNYYAALIHWANPRYKITKQACSSAEIEDTAQKIFAFHSSISLSVVTNTLNYGGKTCSAIFDYNPGPIVDCSKPKAQDDFNLCLKGAGLPYNFEFGKKAMEDAPTRFSETQFAHF